MFLIDTSIIIDVLKGRKETIELVTQLPAAQIYISTITYAEIELGFALLESKNNRKKRTIFIDMIQNQEINLIPFDEKVVPEYVRIQSTLLATGHQLSQFDASIAATAIVYNLTLITRDKDFERVKNLSLYPFQK